MIIERFIKYMDFKGLNDNQVTVDCGLSVGLIGKARKGMSDLGRNTTEKILRVYTDINRSWLLTGEGSMLKDNTGATQTDNTIINPTNTQATMDPLTMDYINTLKEQLATMKEQLKEKDALIRKLTQQGDDEVLSRRLGAVKEKQDELTNKP